MWFRFVTRLNVSTRIGQINSLIESAKRDRVIPNIGDLRVIEMRLYQIPQINIYNPSLRPILAQYTAEAVFEDFAGFIYVGTLQIVPVACSGFFEVEAPFVIDIGSDLDNPFQGFVETDDVEYTFTSVDKNGNFTGSGSSPGEFDAGPCLSNLVDIDITGNITPETLQITFNLTFGNYHQRPNPTSSELADCQNIIDNGPGSCLTPHVFNGTRA